jgi:(E)-4-hydroxy-3-methylbut-2-enyl-diphosphate synthase
MKYCKSFTHYQRFPSHEVQIGNIKMGATHPVVIQSMVNTDTMDVEATVEQVKELVGADCQLVRITAPTVKDAENLKNIKQRLIEEGINVPLVADIHFAPKAADIAATIVEKVRINPGNYVDKKSFKSFDYTDAEYAEELERIGERFIPFLDICKKHKTAIRIGSNHGSLSDRIVNKYGNSPEGMVEAAMEFLRICQKQDFRNVVVSMKASNTQIMTQSTRLLAAKMLEEEMSFPIHLGVTEAGSGDEGRIKSSIGIGALMADGIGDTIRVSLTEHPKEEIPVAEEIVKHFSAYKNNTTFDAVDEQLFNPYLFNKRRSDDYDIIGGTKPAVVIVANNGKTEFKEDSKPDFIVITDEKQAIDKEQKYLLSVDQFRYADITGNYYPYMCVKEFVEVEKPISDIHFVECQLSDVDTLMETGRFSENNWAWNVVLIFNSVQTNSIAEQRSFFSKISALKNPVVLKKDFSGIDDIKVSSASDLGPMFTDGFGDGIWLESNEDSSINSGTAFNILQGARVRMSKTEFISCPSCGRTLFDLEETTVEIKQRLSHLKHLKIGVMGCIVNGPGEMADADYGYVGAGKGNISLYKGQEVVRRNIPSEEAVDELIALIKENGDWQEK